VGGGGGGGGGGGADIEDPITICATGDLKKPDGRAASRCFGGRARSRHEDCDPSNNATRQPS